MILIKKVIKETVKKEINRVKWKLQIWKIAEFETIVTSIIKKGMNFANVKPMEKSNFQNERKKKSYSEAVSNKQEAIIIIKPLEENDASSSEVIKRDIKNKIDVAKLGIGITKMRKATRGAV